MTAPGPVGSAGRNRNLTHEPDEFTPIRGSDAQAFLFGAGDYKSSAAAREPLMSSSPMAAPSAGLASPGYGAQGVGPISVPGKKSQPPTKSSAPQLVSGYAPEQGRIGGGSGTGSNRSSYYT